MYISIYRGDESRTSQGSGLGLLIAKSLIGIQKGRFNIEIDGDLFKAVIYMPRYKDNNMEYLKKLTSAE